MQEHHKNQIKTLGYSPCMIAHTPDYIVCKDRVATANPRLSTSKGCRLWFVLIKKGNEQFHYIRCLLYLAKEENHFPKSICFRTVKERLKTILE